MWAPSVRDRVWRPASPINTTERLQAIPQGLEQLPHPDRTLCRQLALGTGDSAHL